MKMSDGVEWALHCCSMLSAVWPDGSLSGKRLAEFFELPRAYLAKNLQALSRAGIVDTAPGVKGGYRLARKPERITFRDIVTAIEGEGHCFRCTEIRRNGPTGLSPGAYGKPCGIASVMWAAEEAWLAELEKTTLADITRRVVTDVPARQQRLAVKWLEDTRHTRG